MEARRKLSEKEIKQVEEMPKVILHLHLDGSLRPETVKEWLENLSYDDYEKVMMNMTKSERDIVNSLIKEAKQNGKFDLNAVKHCLMVDKDCRDLNQYLEKFHLPGLLLQTEDHIERSVYELYEDLSKQGVIYGEVRFAPCLHTKAGLSYNQIVEAAIKGLERAKKDFNIDGKLILCTMRGKGKENNKENIETVRTAKKYINKGVGAIDIAGAEALFPTQDFRHIFRLARKLKIPFTIHAGEADGPASMWYAIKSKTQRIGHGVRCIYSKRILKYLREHQTPLEMCVTSNFQTLAIPKGVPHPIEKLYEYGLNISLSPDNSTVSNVNIIEEIIYVLENTNLTFEDILQMQKNAIDAAFNTPQKKAEHNGKINKYKKSLEEKEPLTI